MLNSSLWFGGFARSICPCEFHGLDGESCDIRGLLDGDDEVPSSSHFLLGGVVKSSICLDKTSSNSQTFWKRSELTVSSESSSVS